LRSIGNATTLFVINGSSGNDDRVSPNRNDTWPRKGTGVTALGVDGERGNIRRHSAGEVPKLLQAALTTVSVLPSPTSCRSIMASWA
jgi:hypothetical protein